MNGYAQPYYGRQMYGYSYQPIPMGQQMPQVQSIQGMTQVQQPVQPQPIPQPVQNIILQGKSVDSIEVVKAMDIPLDGSVSYFPLTDGTAIVTKQLQMDGTSKTVIYKPVEEDKKDGNSNSINYVTSEDFNEKVKMINEGNSNVQDGIASIQEQIQSLSGNLRELTNEMKNFKGGKR